MGNNMTYILGIHSGHDASITVLKDGKNIFSISEERLNREKGYIGIPVLSLKYIIENKILPVCDEINVCQCILYTESNTKRINAEIEILLKGYGFKNIIFNIYDHHLSHASSAYYGAGIKDALIITSDGEGDDLSGGAYIYENGAIKELNTISREHSVGLMYTGITTMLGFKKSRHEGKITGLAAYGKPDKFDKYLKTLIECVDGNIVPKVTFPNLRKGYLGVIKDCQKFGWLKFIKWRWYRFVKRKIKKQNGWAFHDYEYLFFDQKYSKQDLAAGIQKFTEDILCQYVSYWVKKTGLKKVLLAGGVFANVKVNQRILENCGVDEVFIYPYMADGGLAFGQAVLKYYEDNPHCMETSKTHTMYLGTEYSDSEILKTLNQYDDLEFEKSSDIATDTAKLIADRKIVGWFQGKMEFGPRALGARSVVAMPDDPTINDWLNKRMQRTEFMPFAPSVLAEHMDDIFVIPHGCKRPAEYMTITYDVKPKWREKIGAVNHVDNTARPQMVTKDTNPLYYKMISKVYELTGLPLTINTSFNVHEEPIVMTPDDGINALQRGMVDVLAMGSYLVKIK